MKKLCAFILSVTTAISVFAFQPQIATTENQASAPISSVTQTVKAFVTDDDSIIIYIGNKKPKGFICQPVTVFQKRKTVFTFLLTKEQ